MTGIILTTFLIVIFFATGYLIVLDSVVRARIIMDEALVKVAERLSERLNIIRQMVLRTDEPLLQEKLNYIVQISSKCESIYKMLENGNYSNYTLKELSDTGNCLSKALSGCLAYPIPASDNSKLEFFLTLKNEISLIDKEIQSSIFYLNKTINEYNHLITTFPGFLAALIKRFKPIDTLHLDINNFITCPLPSSPSLVDQAG
ncbi:MAG TPA: LemA family protein [Chitinispirillaceae bacterium]|jgi:hypothetical protein|nr:LemA family protein [Chitinispirillaceae bacterium]